MFTTNLKFTIKALQLIKLLQSNQIIYKKKKYSILNLWGSKKLSVSVKSKSYWKEGSRIQGNSFLSAYVPKKHFNSPVITQFILNINFLPKPEMLFSTKAHFIHRILMFFTKKNIVILHIFITY